MSGKQPLHLRPQRRIVAAVVRHKGAPVRRLSRQCGVEQRLHALPMDLSQPAIPFQFFARCPAVLHANACAVSVGLCAPLVPITLAPRMPRFGASCEKPHASTTLVSGLLPIRVPPYACVVGPMVPSGLRCTATAPAARYHCSILSCMNAAILR